MKSTIQFISSAGSSLALSFGFNSLAERLDPVSNRAAAKNKAGQGIVHNAQSSGTCVPCYAEEIPNV